MTNLKRENIDYDATITLETFIIQVGLKDKNVSLVSQLRNFPKTIISHYFCKWIWQNSTYLVVINLLTKLTSLLWVIILLSFWISFWHKKCSKNIFILTFLSNFLVEVIDSHRFLPHISQALLSNLLSSEFSSVIYE